MEKNIVSVIIPIYNVEHYLEKCVKSVREQTYKQLEILLIDDGSTDASGSICDKLALEDSRIVVVHKENGGLSSARNAGLDIAKGDYYAFIDSDDFIEPQMIETLLTACVNNKVKISCGGRYNINEFGNKKIGLCYKKDAKISSKELFSKMLISDECDFSCCTNLFHKSCFENVRFPNGKIYEDMATTYKAVLTTDYVFVCAKPLYNYLLRSDSITQAKYTVNKLNIVENSKEILTFVSSNYTGLIPRATYLYIKALEGVLSIIDKGTKEERKVNKKTHDLLVAELKSQKAFWLKSKYISFSRKFRYVLFILDLQYLFNRIIKLLK